MSDLRTLQETLRRLIKFPGELIPAGLFRPHPRLTDADKREIYLNDYRFRLLEVFGENFPHLRRYLGEESFTQMVQAYTLAQPPKNYDIGMLGNDLGDFCRHWAPLSQPELAGDLADFEWNLLWAFHQPRKPPLTPEKLQLGFAAAESLILSLQPSIRLISSGWPLHEILRGEGAKTRQKCHYLIYQDQSGAVQWQTISAEACEILHRIRSGATLADAIPEDWDDAEALQQCFAEWMERGLFI